MKTFFFIILLFIISPFPLLAQLVPDFRVNQVLSTHGLWYPNLDVDGQGNFNIVWTDLRRPKGSNRTLFNILCQRYNYNAEPLGENFRINLNPDTANAPSIAVQNSGRFAVCWNELSMNWNRLYFRIFDNNGIPLTNPITINDTVGIESPSVGVSQNGIYTLTWRNRISTSHPYMILAQRIDSLGIKIGNNFRVDDYDDSSKDRPKIVVRKDGSFIITWEDRRDVGQANHHIYMQMFDPNGKPIGANQRVSEYTDWLDIHQIPKISSDSAGNFIIIWKDSRGGGFPETNNYAQAYNRFGEKIGNNFLLIEYPPHLHQNLIHKLNDGRYIFGSTSARGIYQRYDSSNVKIGGIRYVTDQSNYQDYVDIKSFGDRIINLWADYRNSSAGDIYCNIRSFQNPDSVLSNINLISSEVPESFELYQNYPNPFNPTTIITYQLSMAVNVRLSVHDMLGREVVILVNENQNAGKYNVRFPNNVYQFSTGIYFYRIEAGSFIESKRMVLIK